MGFFGKNKVPRAPAKGRGADLLCKDCYQAVMEEFRKRADAADLIPAANPNCSQCYYFLPCESLAAAPPPPMTRWPSGSGVCNLGQRKPFTMSPGMRLQLVGESDHACYDFEQGGGRTKDGDIRLGGI
jgi:hypothetical protein